MDTRRSAKQLMINQMKLKILTITLLSLLCSLHTVAQDSSETENMPVPTVFWGSRLVDMQTVNTSTQGKLEFEILHRFGTIQNGFEDMLGVYAPSNIAMGINYGISQRLDAQINAEKDNRTYDFGLKYRVLRQNISGSMPLSLSYAFDCTIDGRDEENFGKYYKFSNRYIFTNQLMVAKQLNYNFNLQGGMSFTHFNCVDSLYQSDYVELSLAGGYKFKKNRSLFVSYQHPLAFTAFMDNKEATFKPTAGFTIGYEKSRPGHNFQLFLSNRKNINLGKNILYSTKPISLDNLLIGFNIRIVPQVKTKK